MIATEQKKTQTVEILQVYEEVLDTSWQEVSNHFDLEQYFQDTEGLLSYTRDMLQWGNWEGITPTPEARSKVSLITAFENLHKNSTKNDYCKALQSIAEGKMDQARLESFPIKTRASIRHLMKLMDLKNINRYQYVQGRDPILLSDVHNYMMNLIRTQLTSLQGENVANSVAYRMYAEKSLAIGKYQDNRRVYMLPLSEQEDEMVQQLFTAVTENETIVDTYSINTLARLISILEKSLQVESLESSTILDALNAELIKYGYAHRDSWIQNDSLQKSFLQVGLDFLQQIYEIKIEQGMGVEASTTQERDTEELSSITHVLRKQKLSEYKEKSVYDNNYQSFGFHTHREVEAILLKHLHAIQNEIYFAVREALLTKAFLNYIKIQEIDMISEKTLTEESERLDRYAFNLTIQMHYIHYIVCKKQEDPPFQIVEALTKILDMQDSDNNPNVSDSSQIVDDGDAMAISEQGGEKEVIASSIDAQQNEDKMEIDLDDDFVLIPYISGLTGQSMFSGTSSGQQQEENQDVVSSP